MSWLEIEIISDCGILIGGGFGAFFFARWWFTRS